MCILIFLFRILDICYDCVGVYKNRDGTAKKECEKKDEYTDHKAYDGKQDLHADEPKTSIQIKGEDQARQFDTPCANGEEHFAYKIVC